MNAEICLVFNGWNARSRWLPKIRSWVNSNKSLFRKLGVEVADEETDSIGRALRSRSDNLNDRVIVAVGFGRREIEGYANAVAPLHEPVIALDPSTPEINASASASFTPGERLAPYS